MIDGTKKNYGCLLPEINDNILSLKCSLNTYEEHASKTIGNFLLFQSLGGFVCTDIEVSDPDSI